MASLNPTFRLGNTSPSALIKSASSAATAVQDYNDKLQAAIYADSAKTNDDFNAYQTYLNGRIGNLSTSTSIADASKMLTLTQTLTDAAKTNTSAEIQRENIQVMSGSATLSDKYNTIVNQYQRAVANNDLGLAQSLESQAYSVSQSIQYQAQQSASASRALSTANAAYQGDIVTSLGKSLDQLNYLSKASGQNGMNTAIQQWVKGNAANLATLGVVIPAGAQPNYFDLVSGIATAQYNATVLKAQALSATDPLAAQNAMLDAQAIVNGQTGFSTITMSDGKTQSMNFYDLQSAASNPSEFIFDNKTGGLVKAQQVGYGGYNALGQPEGVYSGSVPGKNAATSGTVGDSNVQTMFFFNPNQTAEMHGLGLQFSMADAAKGSPKGTTGTAADGVEVQATGDTPAWLQAIIGKNGITNAYTDANGNVQFKGQATDGTGGSAYYTLTSVGGLSGVFEHQQDGSLKLAGGDYGFDSGAASLLVNQAVQQQNQIAVEKAQQQQTLTAAVPSTVQQLSVNAPSSAPTTSVQKTAPVTTLQPTVNPQQASKQSTQILQPAGSTSINQSGSGGIKLTQTSGPSIKL